MPTPIVLSAHSRPVTEVKFNREGDLLFSCGRDAIACVYRSKDGSPIGTYEGHEGAILCLDVNRKTTLVATGASDQSGRVWEAETGKELVKFDIPSVAHAVAFSLKDTYLLAAIDQKFRAVPGIYVYKLDANLREQKDMEPVAKLVIEEDPDERTNIKSAMWYDNNRSIIAAYEDGMVRKWDVKTRKVVQEVRACTEKLAELSISKDETMLIASSIADKCAKLLDAKSLEILKTYKTNHPIRTASISPKFRQVVIGGGVDAKLVAQVSAAQQHFEVDFWHLVYQKYMGSMKGFFSTINCSDFHPSGNSFATGAEEGQIRLVHFDDEYFESSKEMEMLDLKSAPEKKN